MSPEARARRVLDGRTAVVTGAGHGIGRAVAIDLSDAGANVVLADVDEDALQRTGSLLHGEFITVTCDVSEEDGVERYLAAGRAQFGTIDLHHVNAGIVGSLQRLRDVGVDEFDRVLAVNVRGAFLGVRGAMRMLEDARRGGSIVITTSIHGLRGSADLVAYQISKHALVGLIRSASIDGGPLGIRVNGVAPGVIPTPDEPATRADMIERAKTGPMRRAGSVEEVAGAVRFLLSDESSYTTGHVLSVDGGAAVVNVVRPSGGAGAWDAEAADRARYTR